MVSLGPYTHVLENSETCTSVTPGQLRAVVSKFDTTGADGKTYEMVGIHSRHESSCR